MNNSVDVKVPKQGTPDVLVEGALFLHRNAGPGGKDEIYILAHDPTEWRDWLLVNLRTGRVWQGLERNARQDLDNLVRIHDLYALPIGSSVTVTVEAK